MEREQSVAEIFAAAIDIESASRADFLRDRCGSDLQLLDRLTELLTAFDDPMAEDFLSIPAIEMEAANMAADDEPASDPYIGGSIGNYQVIAKIGAGGMGTIYMASRTDDYKKCVAIKIIKRGMDTEAILKRFRNERQILANLDHPNIARLIDGGTTHDGLPFLVMEYVEGSAIDEYCADRDPDIPRRIKLFRAVCMAVSFAHRNLVVHRDLKPSNILIAEDGTPKLLDFGIAKILNDADTDITRTNLRVLTPAYASPEQRAGEAITTATDIYSLGIVLHEILTGNRPDEPSVKKNIAVHSSGRRRSLDRDLKNIVAQAIHPDAQRRYASVEHLSDDLGRYVDGLPVAARSDTFWYRSEKFIKRHKIGVAVTIFILLIMIGGTAAILREDAMARTERARAERRFNDVRALVNVLLSQLNDEMAKVSGTTPARTLLVKQTLEYLNSAARDTGDDQLLEHELAMAYVSVGDIQGNSYHQNLGDTSGALASYQNAKEIYERLIARAPSDLDIKSEYAQLYRSIGDVEWDTGDLNATLENYDRGTHLVEDMTAASPDNPRIKLLLARFYAALGDIKYDEGFQSYKDLAASLKEHDRARAIREQLLADDPANTEIEIDLNQSYQRLANNYRLTGRFADEFDLLQRSETIVNDLLARDSDNPSRMREAAVGYARFVTYYLDAGDLEKAGDYNRRSLDLRTEIYDANRMDARARRDLAFGYLINGNLQTEKADFKKALESYQKQLDLYTDLARLDASNRDRQRDLVDGLINTANALLKTGETSSAYALFERALKISRTFPSDDLQTRINLALIYEGIGSALIITGNDRSGAAENFYKAIELREAEVDSDKMNVVLLAELAKTYLKAGKALEKRNDQTTMLLFKKSQDIWEKLSEQNSLRKTDIKSFEETKLHLSQQRPALNTSSIM